jgi:hypothetical protein
MIDGCMGWVFGKKDGMDGWVGYVCALVLDWIMYTLSPSFLLDACMCGFSALLLFSFDMFPFHDASLSERAS